MSVTAKIETVDSSLSPCDNPALFFERNCTLEYSGKEFLNGACFDEQELFFLACKEYTKLSIDNPETKIEDFIFQVGLEDKKSDLLFCCESDKKNLFQIC